MGQRKIEGPSGRGKTVLTLGFLQSAFYFVVALGILVFFHELGHFVLAKSMGVGVLTFSLGFGPKLIGWKKGETQYQVALIPLGGYVKLIGENLQEEVKEEDRARSFWAQPVWKRALIIIAGPFFNFFLAVAIFCLINLIVGVPPTPPLPLPSKVGEVTPGSPAEKAGLQAGDRILSIDGEPVSKWDDLALRIRKSQGKELTIQVERGGQTRDVKVSPQPMKEMTPSGEETIFIIGIKAPMEEMKFERVGPAVALGKGFVQTGQLAELTVVVIIKLIKGEISAKTIGGPILIAQMAGEQGKKGALDFFLLIALLSINLGVINLFPIPILDGGHFLFLTMEALMRKPISIRKMEIAQQIGLILIILLMIFAFYNDILRMFTPGGMKF
jgi:regulator of sigma E protease